MTSRKVDAYALTLWELAEHGSPVDVALWERVVGISREGPRGEGRRASPENQRQTFKRFRDWCAEHGLAIEKRIVEGEPIVIEFDASAARSLAVKLRPRLSRRTCRTTTMHDQQLPPTHIGQSAQDEHLDPKSVARLLDLQPRTVRDLVKRGEIVAIRVGHKIRVSRSSLRAFIERSVVKASKADRKGRA